MREKDRMKYVRYFFRNEYRLIFIRNDRYNEFTYEILVYYRGCHMIRRESNITLEKALRIACINLADNFMSQYHVDQEMF